LDKVLARGAFDLDRILELEPEFLGEDHHHHDDDIQSYSFKTMQPLDHDRFQRWMGDLVAVKGPDILRSKGILAFKNEPRRFVFQGVHMLLDGDLQREWKADEPRESRLVFIGRNLNRDELKAGFERCIA
jgi:G3E family GTPase